MRLSLSLRDWMCHRDLTLTTEAPVTIVTSANGAGKTAILDALEFVICGTGRRRKITTKRDLALLSIRDDAAQTRVALEIPDVGLVLVRSMDRHGDQAVEINGAIYPMIRAQAKIAEILGCDVAQTRAALEAEALLAGDAKERRAILFSAAGAEATLGEIGEALEERNLDPADPEIGALAQLAATEGFDVAAKQAEMRRAECTRLLREPLPEVPEAVFLPTWTKTAFHLDQLEVGKLEKRRATLERMLGEASRAQGLEAGRHEEAIAATERRHAELVEEGTRLTDEEPTDEAVEALLERARALDPARERHREARTLHGRLVRDLEALEVGEIEKPDLCPAIPGEPKCPMTARRLADHRKALERRHEEIAGEVSTAEEALAAAESALRDAEAAHAEHAVHRHRRARILEIQGSLATLESTIEENRRALEEATKAPAVEESTSNPVFVQERLDRLHAVLDVKRRYDRAHEARLASESQRGGLEEKRARWDALAKAFAPDGIPTRLLVRRSEPLVGYLEEIGADRFKTRVTGEGDLEIDQNGRWRRFQQLSESGQLRLSVVASHLVARSAGFPLLVVDRFDHFDPRWRLIMVHGLRAAARYYPAGVIVLATLGQAMPKRTPFEDVSTVWLVDGDLREVAA